jgi:delta 1-pyrroline-5-carboxylate dehydrogenase
MANPTPAGIRALALKYPQHGKVYSELLTGLSGEQRTAALGDTASLAAALSGGRTDVASRLVDQRIEAMRTRGEQTADVEALRDAIKTNRFKFVTIVDLVDKGTDRTNTLVN